MNTILIHTNGSCETHTRLGGWAVLLEWGTHRRELSGSAADTTINAMKLTAAIQGLAAIKHTGVNVQMITSSIYVVKGMTEWLPDWIARGWKTASNKPVANRELWEQLHTLVSRHQVTFTWLPREQNTTAAGLAQHARLSVPSTSQPETSAPAAPTPTTHLMITGSAYATRRMLDYARKVVQRAHERGYTILVGDRPKGIEMAVVHECRRLNTKVIVVGLTHRPRNGGCAHGGYVRVERDTYLGMNHTLLNKFNVRDRWMVDNATLGIFISDDSSADPRSMYEYMRERGKEAYLMNFSQEARHG